MSKNLGDNKTIELWKFSVNLYWALVTIKMATRKIEESFSKKLDSDSEILSLHHWKKQQVTNFYYLFKNNIFICSSLPVSTTNTDTRSY